MTGGPEAVVAKAHSDARFDVDGRNSEPKIARVLLCATGCAIGEILWRFFDMHRVHEQTQCVYI